MAVYKNSSDMTLELLELYTVFLEHSCSPDGQPKVSKHWSWHTHILVQPVFKTLHLSLAVMTLT